MAPDDQQPTAVEPQAPEAPSQDDQEWEAAAEDFKNEAGVKVEEAKPNEAPQAPEDPTPPTEGAETATPPEGEATPESTPESTPQDTVIRDQRAIQREILEDQKAMREDIRNEMFKDAVKTELLDDDGDPITSPEDLTKRINANTGKPFTPEEATAYLLQWRMDTDKKIEAQEKQIEQIADIQLTIKDQADNVLAKYGALLKEQPELGKELWDNYAETLEKNEDSGIITKAPVSLERFADIALKGHQAAFEARQTAAQPAAPSPEQVQQEEKQKEVVKKQTRSDREDIFSGGKTETMDAEEKEWAKAAKEHYEG